MRIAILTETFLPKVDGIVNTLCRLLDYLDTHRHNVMVLAPRGAPRRYHAIPVYPLQAVPFPLYPQLCMINPGINLYPVLDKFKPDLLHVVNPFMTGKAVAGYTHRRNIPLVMSYHTDLPGFAARWGFGFISEPARRYMRWVHNQADLNLCPSSATRQELLQYGYQRLRIWSRGVDTDLFSPARRSDDMRNRLSGGNPDAPLLLYVGRLSVEKRVSWLLPVMQALPGVRLALVGDGPQRPELEEMFAGLPVVFTGFLQGEELAAAYASADLFVFPAANETFGNVALEATASGLPVIAPRAGGVMDTVIHGNNGLLCDPENPDDLVVRVNELIHAPETMTAMGASARQFALKRSWADVFTQLVNDYCEIISRPRRRIQRPRWLPSLETIKD